MIAKYVHVFILFSLISMNRKINYRRFRKYPKAGLVLEALVAPSPAGVDDMLLDWSCLK